MLLKLLGVVFYVPVVYPTNKNPVNNIFTAVIKKL